MGEDNLRSRPSFQYVYLKDNLATIVHRRHGSVTSSATALVLVEVLLVIVVLLIASPVATLVVVVASPVGIATLVVELAGAVRIHGHHGRRGSVENRRVGGSILLLVVLVIVATIPLTVTLASTAALVSAAVLPPGPRALTLPHRAIPLLVLHQLAILLGLAGAHPGDSERGEVLSSRHPPTHIGEETMNFIIKNLLLDFSDCLQPDLPHAVKGLPARLQHGIPDDCRHHSLVVLAEGRGDPDVLTGVNVGRHGGGEGQPINRLRDRDVCHGITNLRLVHIIFLL